jgi:hypothetical protein
MVAIRLLCSRAMTYFGAKECGALPAGIRTLVGSITAALTGVNRSADVSSALERILSLRVAFTLGCSGRRPWKKPSLFWSLKMTNRFKALLQRLLSSIRPNVRRIALSAGSAVAPRDIQRDEALRYRLIIWSGAEIGIAVLNQIVWY